MYSFVDSFTYCRINSSHKITAIINVDTGVCDLQFL